MILPRLKKPHLGQYFGHCAAIAAIAAILLGISPAESPAESAKPLAIGAGPFAEMPFDSTTLAKLRTAARSYVRVRIYDKKFSRDYTTFDSRVVVEASGIIISENGHVLTAAHIARNTGLGARLETLSGQQIEATIIARDPSQDVALLKIEPFEGMTAATLAAGPPPRSGTPVLAIGSPAGRRGVPATGRILLDRSATRLEYGAYGFDDAIEIEIAAASRYSGGPVIDTNGEVTGMIAAFLNADTSKPGYQMPGVAFAVPAATLRAYLAKWGAR